MVVRDTPVDALSERQAKQALKQIKNEQLDDFFEEHGSGTTTKPWQEAEWVDRREEQLDDECQWCEADEDLQLHHQEHRKPDWNQEWIQIENELFEDSDAFDSDRHIEGREECPRCGKQSYYERTTMTPTYRCQSCNAEFGEPNVVTPAEMYERSQRPTKTPDYFRDKLRWVTGNVEVVLEAFSDRYREYWEEYRSLDDTITICRKCHYMYHERGMAICAICGDQYAKYRKRDFQEYVCWDCVVEEKGLEECPECGDNWYDPDRNSACKSCNTLW